MPGTLLRVGKVCEQIAFGKSIFSVRSKNAPIPTERAWHGQRGPYCLDLEAIPTDGTKVQKSARNTKCGICGRQTTQGCSDSRSIEGNNESRTKTFLPNFVGVQLSSRYHTTRNPGTDATNPSSSRTWRKPAPLVLSEPVEGMGISPCRRFVHKVNVTRLDPFRHMG